MDEDLAAIESIQKGSETGIKFLMTRHKESVFRLAFRYTGNEADAAELTVETFYRVHRNAGRFQPKAKVRTWIFTIAANLCKDHLRRQRKHRNAIQPDSISGLSQTENLPASDPTPRDSILSSEKIEQIESAIRDLPDRLRLPFLLCVLEDHSYDECAQLLKTNRKSVETRIYRARQRLRKQMGGSTKNRR